MKTPQPFLQLPERSEVLTPAQSAGPKYNPRTAARLFWLVQGAVGLIERGQVRNEPEVTAFGNQMLRWLLSGEEPIESVTVPRQLLPATISGTAPQPHQKDGKR